jgi:hypothetical protein
VARLLYRLAIRGDVRSLAAFAEQGGCPAKIKVAVYYLKESRMSPFMRAPKRERIRMTARGTKGIFQSRAEQSSRSSVRGREIREAARCLRSSTGHRPGHRDDEPQEATSLARPAHPAPDGEGGGGGLRIERAISYRVLSTCSRPGRFRLSMTSAVFPLS